MPERMRQLLPSVLSVLLALAVCWALIALTMEPGTATDAYLQMLWGGIGNWPAYLDGARPPSSPAPWAKPR